MSVLVLLFVEFEPPKCRKNSQIGTSGGDVVVVVVVVVVFRQAEVVPWSSIDRYHRRFLHFSRTLVAGGILAKGTKDGRNTICFFLKIRPPLKLHTAARWCEKVPRFLKEICSENMATENPDQHSCANARSLAEMKSESEVHRFFGWSLIETPLKITIANPREKTHPRRTLRCTHGFSEASEKGFPPTRNLKWRDDYLMNASCDCLEPQTTIKKWMFGETTISYVKIGNHPIETTIYKWLALGFQVGAWGFLKSTKLQTWKDPNKNFWLKIEEVSKTLRIQIYGPHAPYLWYFYEFWSPKDRLYRVDETCELVHPVFQQSPL